MFNKIIYFLTSPRCHGTDAELKSAQTDNVDCWITYSPWVRSWCRAVRKLTRWDFRSFLLVQSSSQSLRYTLAFALKAWPYYVSIHSHLYHIKLIVCHQSHQRINTAWQIAPLRYVSRTLRQSLKKLKKNGNAKSNMWAGHQDQVLKYLKWMGISRATFMILNTLVCTSTCLHHELYSFSHVTTF